MEYVKKLSEAILLQSLEDLYSREYRLDALKFFGGEGFNICASIIGLRPEECRKIFEMVNTSKAVKQITLITKGVKKISHVPKIDPRIINKNVRHEAVCYP